MVETIYTAELPAAERLTVKRNRITGASSTGPRVAVVTGIHGDELEGQYVAFELARQLSTQRQNLSGCCDIYPALNPMGINSIDHRVPLFDIDLDRTFPGDPNGGPTEALAAAIVDDLSSADVCVDIHASNIFLREMPQIRINERFADMLLPLAPLLNVSFVWVRSSFTADESSLAYALNSRGTPCLVVETGVGMRITEDYCLRLVDGIMRLIAHFGGWAGGYIESLGPRVARDQDVTELASEESGVFLPRHEHGSHIERGEVVGIVVDPLTAELTCELRSPVSGLLLTLREYPVVYPGSLLARIVRDAA